jgi:NADH-quinone oxidoreductase subunit E
MIQDERGAPSAEGAPEMGSLFTRIKQEFKGRPEELIPLLQNVQRALGFLPEEALMEIARFIRMPAAKVFGTVTFYSQFRLKPAGKYIIRVCRGTACHVKGSDRMLDDVQAHLQTKPGETTPDGLFTIETVACFGSCALAPIMVVNDTVYGNVKRSNALQLLEDIGNREQALLV